jgi:hypothetical protein
MSLERTTHAIYVESDQAAASRMASVARSEGRLVIDLELAGVTDSPALDARISSVFKIPYPFVGPDAVVSLVADLDWLPSPGGYLVIVTGLDSCPAQVTTDVAHVLPSIIDRWRSGGVPFLATMVSLSSRRLVLDGLEESNRRLAEAGKLSWARSDTGPVPVIVDGVAGALDDTS